MNTKYVFESKAKRRIAATLQFNTKMSLNGAIKDVIRPKSFCLSFSSWFCLPDQGMVDLEILCRASAFVVPAKKKTSYSQHILTVSHAAAPWRWPKLYKDDWLQFVHEKHCHYTAELRYNNGDLATQLDMASHMYLHPKRDLAVFHLEDEEKGLELLSTLKLQSDWKLLPDAENPLPNSRQLMFHGHEVMDKEIFADEKNDKAVVPLDVPGYVHGRSPQQIFCKTKRVLPLGMCGGPVVTKNVGEDCVAGLLEGIVPGEYSDLSLRNMAVFVESKEIQKFLDEIENGEAEQLITGAVAYKAVGPDQDPDKMDLSKIF